MGFSENPEQVRLREIKANRSNELSSGENIFANSDDKFLFDQLEMYQRLHQTYLDRYVDMVGELNDGTASDGYHTFNELYDHRMILFAVICKHHPKLAWKSKLHDDGSMYDDYFIVGIETPEGHYSYHYPLEHWDLFEGSVLEKAPEWDGHVPADITRLMSLKIGEDSDA